MPNNTLKSTAHTDYDADYSWWDRTTGVLRLNQGNSADAPLSHPTADPGYTLYAVFNCAITNRYTYYPTTARIGVGLYGYQTSAWDWLTGAYEMTGTVIGSPASPTTRYYRVHARTARGFTILSDMLTVAGAPGNPYDIGTAVLLIWPRVLNFGVLGYDVYRFTEQATFTDTDVSIGSSIALPSHPFDTGDPVTLVKGVGGTLPAPLAEEVTYYVIKIDPNTIQLASSYADAIALTEIIFTTTGSAHVHSIREIRLLRQVETGLNSMQDNGTYTNQTTIPYPTADFDGLKAYTATAPNVVTNLSIDGVSAAWDTLPFAIKVPANFDKSTMPQAEPAPNEARNFQWLRIKMEGLDPEGGSDRPDFRVTGVVSGVTGSLDYTSAAGAFTAGLIGKNCIVRSKYSTFEALVNAVPDPNTIQLAFGSGEWPFGDNYPYIEMIVEGGGPSGGVHIDLAHLSYGPNAIFAFHPDDLSAERGVPPVAANGSTQGGTTILTGGGDGTIFGNQCVAFDEMVTVTDGMGAIFQEPAGSVEQGSYLFNHAKRITEVADMTYTNATIWRVETENGFYAEVSETHKFLTDKKDTKGTPLKTLDVGQNLLTSIDGVEVLSPIKAKYIAGQGTVVQFDLPQDRRFLCGRWEDHVCRKWGGIASHNKAETPLDGPIVV